MTQGGDVGVVFCLQGSLNFSQTRKWFPSGLFTSQALLLILPSVCFAILILRISWSLSSLQFSRTFYFIHLLPPFLCFIFKRKIKFVYSSDALSVIISALTNLFVTFNIFSFYICMFERWLYQFKRGRSISISISAKLLPLDYSRPCQLSRTMKSCIRN